MKKEIDLFIIVFNDLLGKCVFFVLGILNFVVFKVLVFIKSYNKYSNELEF